MTNELSWKIEAQYQSRPQARGDAWVFRVERKGVFWGLLVDEQTRYKTRFEPGSESHDDLDEFIVCLEGRYWVRVGSWARTLAPGEVAIIPNGVPHDSGVATNLVGMHFLVLLFPKDLAIAEAIAPGGVAMPPGALSWIKGAFKFLRSSPNEVGILPLSVLPDFIRMIASSNRLPSDASHPDMVVAEVIKLIEQPEPPSLEVLAAHVGLTPSHLQRRFMSAVGSSPLQYARAWQLDRIAQALRAGSTLPILEIAAEHGFNDPKHFRAMFKRRFGTTPVAYRKNHPSE